MLKQVLTFSFQFYRGCKDVALRHWSNGGPVVDRRWDRVRIKEWVRWVENWKGVGKWGGGRTTMSKWGWGEGARQFSGDLRERRECQDFRLGLKYNHVQILRSYKMGWPFFEMGPAHLSKTLKFVLWAT